MAKLGVLFVCTGNICRSPAAEGIFRQRVQTQAPEILDSLRIESAGVASYHRNEPPDSRTSACALERGYDLSGLRAQQVQPKDLEEFAFVIAMDHGHKQALEGMQGQNQKKKIWLLSDFSQGSWRDVPDPYYGPADGHDRVLDLLEEAMPELLHRVKQHLIKQPLAG